MKIRDLVAVAILSLSFFLLVAVGGCSKRKLPTAVSVHPPDWSEEHSPNFHGKKVERDGLPFCAQCHGSDYRGGQSGSSCYECHPNGPEDCTLCHGGVDNETGAPPYGLNGDSLTSYKGVGAHSTHVQSGDLKKGFECIECHREPGAVDDPGHIDSSLPAEIVWGQLAQTEGATPSWDGISTCKDVYCHGEFAGGETTFNPVWTQVDGTQAACGTCHSMNPTTNAHPDHLTSYDFPCQLCHHGYVPDESVVIDTHVNGIKDVVTDPSVGGSFSQGVCLDVLCHGAQTTPDWSTGGTLTCVSCHGGADNETGAPPPDLNGHTAASFKGVGAHTPHVTEGDLRTALECTECHRKPSELSDPGHIDAHLLPAEIAWGPLAQTLNATPNWDGSSTCTDVYCHGNFAFSKEASENPWVYQDSLIVGNNYSPSWIKVGAGEAGCGTCHGLPPQGHIPQTTCSNCHRSVVDENNLIIDKTKHINGQIDVFGE
ncbi:MAG: CxxxxCH/CxxCH domain-containing protein [bacterium]